MHQGLSVIGAGFGRTGTLSLKAALEELGFDPCCHMLEVSGRSERAAMWLAAAQGMSVDWREVLRGYRATVDWPGSAFYRELMETFPEAKVVLTVRDPERWYHSASETIHTRASAGLPGPEDTIAMKMVRAVVWERSMHGSFDDRDEAIRIFNRHIAEVKSYVPSDRLLVFNVKEGWRPLCDFLERPAPRTAFPHINDRETFNDPAAFERLAEQRVSKLV